MITLLGILVVIGIISTYRIYKSCKKQDISFNPLDGSLIEYLGFVFGVLFPGLYVLSTFIYLIVKYLP
jgi:hypothetical protein